MLYVFLIVVSLMCSYGVVRKRISVHELSEILCGVDSLLSALVWTHIGISICYCKSRVVIHTCFSKCGGNICEYAYLSVQINWL